MRISESILRRIVREEIESIDREKEKLIVQDDELDELGGYDIDRPAIPGQTTKDPQSPAGFEYEDVVLRKGKRIKERG